MNSTHQTNKFSRFLRNNAALLLLLFCVVAVTAVVLAVSLAPEEDPNLPVDGPNDNPVDNPNDNPNDTPVDNPNDNPPTPTVVTEKIYFVSPLQYQKVGMEYTNNEDILFVFNPTLNSWQSHRAVDLIAPENTAVVAMYDGTVVDVAESYGMGHYVTIDHGENVIATYASLTDVKVVEGQTVAKGEQIGVVSTTASYEFSDGAHLHLEVKVDGVIVDPMPYVDGKVYREVEKTVQSN